MRVLEINALYGQGSTGLIVKDIQNCLNANGIDCYTAYMGCPAGEMPKGYHVGNIVDYKLHALNSRIKGKQAYYSKLSTVRLCRYISRLNPDIVQLHNVHNNYVNLPLLLKFLAKMPACVVLTMHDCWFFTGGCFHYYAANCDKWQTGCLDCPKRFSDTPAYLGDYSSEIYKDRIQGYSQLKNLVVVGVSEWVSNEARKSILKDRPIYTIHNGIDLETFRYRTSDLRKCLGLEGKKVILGPASKWLSEVNKNTLTYFTENMCDGCVLLLFGSSNPDQYIAPNVISYGFVHNRVEMAELYSMGDVLVNCSREDTLSTINIEAQACGTPVVTYDSTGSKETVDGEISLWVAVGDCSELLKRTNEVLLMDTEAVAEKCRRFVCKHFDKETNFKEYITLFNSIIKER